LWTFGYVFTDVVFGCVAVTFQLLYAHARNVCVPPPLFHMLLCT
jgi:hypothetical protein